MICRPDNFRLPPEELAVRIYGERLIGNADHHGPAQDGQGLHRLFHGPFEADHLQGNVHTPAPGQTPQLGHRVPLAGVYGNSPIRLGQPELGFIYVDGIDSQRPKGPGKLDGRHAEPASAKDGDRLAGLQPGLAQGMERRRGRAHEGCSLFERHHVRQRDGISLRNGNELGIAAIAMLAQHLAFATELLVSRAAIVALATSKQIVEAYPITDGDVGHL